MSGRRVMGIETEYGIAHPGHPNANPIRMSALVVNAYGALTDREAALARRWDYDDESPLRDARGFDMSRADADVSQLTDDTSTANAVLTNGARFYVDHAHPEYSSPEVTNPWDAVVWDRAGMVLSARAAAAARHLPGGHEIVLYKNNTDGKGASYGTHENYLVARQVPFRSIVDVLTAFLVTRQVFTGSGRVGIGQDGRGTGFQLSSRADFFETEVGLETTLKRPIINTRDEPHADPAVWRRLHVIVGDANMSEFATLLKLGSTSLVLAAIEAGADPELRLANPVSAMHQVSHDLDMTQPLELVGREPMTALQIQGVYLDLARQVASDAFGPRTAELLDSWAEILELLEKDPRKLSDRLDWAAKLAILEGYRVRDGLDWSAHRLSAVDLQYSDMRPDRGLALRLEQRGSLRRITSDDQVERALATPPPDTRAWFRGECVRRFGQSVAAASWDSVILDVPGRTSLMRIPTQDPLRGTREHVGALFDRVSTVTELVTALTGGSDTR